MMEQTDLFGYTPAQGSLLGRVRIACKRRVTARFPIRKPSGHVSRLCSQKCVQPEMPWSERDARMWQIVFPNMAKWLPDEEADQLRFEFAQEMRRLSEAA